MFVNEPCSDNTSLLEVITNYIIISTEKKTLPMNDTHSRNHLLRETRYQR